MQSWTLALLGHLSFYALGRLSFYALGRLSSYALEVPTFETAFRPFCECGLTRVSNLVVVPKGPQTCPKERWNEFKIQDRFANIHSYGTRT